MVLRATFVIVMAAAVGALAFDRPSLAQAKKPITKKPITKKPNPALTVQQAISRNDLARLKELLEANPALLNQRDRNQGDTPLLWALNYNKPEIARYLLAQGADVNIRSTYNYTALHLAVRRNKDLVHALLDKKANINVQDNGGYTPLMHAIRYAGSPENAQLLIEAGADVNLAASSKQTALHLACQSGQETLVALVPLLLEKTANPDVRDSAQNTPLFYAAQRSLPAVKALLEKKADVRAVGQHKYTPLHMACSSGQAEIAEELLAKGAYVGAATSDGYQPIHVAAKTANRDVIAVLLRHQADPNVKTDQGQTPLQFALKAAEGVDAPGGRFPRNSTPPSNPGRFLVVDELFAVSNDIEIKLTSGESLFHWCARNGMEKSIAKLLKQLDAKPHEADKQGRTPLALACEAGHVKVVRHLLDTKPNLAQSDGNETLLHVAAWNGHTEVAEALLAAGAEIAPKESSYTPLHAAAWNGHANTIKVLLKHKAEVDAKDSDGYTPLHKAAWRGHLEAVKALVVAGADVNAKDIDGFTPLTKAKSGKKTDVASFLAANGAK
jgi:cytohesin